MPTPTVYECSKCHAKGVKLWREYQTFLNHQELFCRACAEKDQNYEEKIKKNQERSFHHIPTDQIGWLVPAVPDIFPKGPDWKLDKNGTFWGYTSVPPEGVAWWYALEGIAKR